MRFFEFLRPDKSPQNARMPKRKKAKNLQKEQPTHTPHPHNENAPRSFHEYTPKFRNALKSEVSDYLKRPSKFPPTQQSPPKFHNAPKSKVSDYLKRPSKFPPTQQSTPKFHNVPNSKVSGNLKRPSKFPPTQQNTPKFHNALKSKVSGYLKRPSKFLYTHEVREFRTIQRPNTPQPYTPRSLSGSLIASKIPTFQGKILHLRGLDRPPPAPPRTGGNPSVCVPKNA